MRPVGGVLAVDQILGNPRIHRVVGKRVAEVLGMVVGGVGIPEVDVEEPVVVAAVGFQPAFGRGIHLVRVLQAVAARVVGFAEPVPDLVRRVPVRERADAGGVVAGLPQGAGKGSLCQPGPKRASRSLRRHVSVQTPVVHHTGADAELAREQGSATG